MRTLDNELNKILSKLDILYESYQSILKLTDHIHPSPYDGLQPKGSPLDTTFALAVLSGEIGDFSQEERKKLAKHFGVPKSALDYVVFTKMEL